MRNGKIHILFLIIIIMSFLYSHNYSIRDNEYTIAEKLEALYNRPKHNSLCKITIYKMNDFYNEKIVLFKVTDGSTELMGDAVLSRGLNGKYKFSEMGYGTNFIRIKRIVKDDTLHLIIMGKNYDRKIETLQVIVNNSLKIYDNISNEDYYIKIFPLSSEHDDFNGFPKIILYDYDGNDITDEIDTLHQQFYRNN